MTLHENNEYSGEVALLAVLKCSRYLFKPFAALLLILPGILMVKFGRLEHEHSFSHILGYPRVVRKFKLSLIGHERAFIFKHPVGVTQQRFFGVLILFIFAVDLTLQTKIAKKAGEENEIGPSVLNVQQIPVFDHILRMNCFPDYRFSLLKPRSMFIKDPGVQKGIEVIPGPAIKKISMG